MTLNGHFALGLPFWLFAGKPVIGTNVLQKL